LLGDNIWRRGKLYFKDEFLTGKQAGKIKLRI